MYGNRGVSCPLRLGKKIEEPNIRPMFSNLRLDFATAIIIFIAQSTYTPLLAAVFVTSAGHTLCVIPLIRVTQKLILVTTTSTWSIIEIPGNLDPVPELLLHLLV